MPIKSMNRDKYSEKTKIEDEDEIKAVFKKKSSRTEPAKKKEEARASLYNDNQLVMPL